MDTNFSLNRSTASLTGTSGAAPTASPCVGSLPDLAELAAGILCGSSSSTQSASASIDQTVMRLSATEGTFLNMTSLGGSFFASDQPPQDEDFHGKLHLGKPWMGGGTYEYENGAKIKGTWQQGKLVGRFQQVSTFCWEGEYRGDQVYLTSKDGVELIVASLEEGVFHGKGSSKNPDGSTWIGEFRQGKIWLGKGTVLNFNGVYETGTWAQGGLRQGPFTITNPNQSTWTGEFQQGKIWSGGGALLYSNGILETGNWVAGKPEGLFTRINPDQSTWTGEFQQGKIWSGKGTMLWSNGVYERGTWVEGKREGPFTRTNPNNSTWTGEWQQGQIWSGEGTDLCYNGVLETGKWVEGKREGRFTMTNPNNSTWSGECRQGKMWSGKGTMLRSNGVYETGILVEGKRVSDVVAKRTKPDKSSSSSSSASEPSSSSSSSNKRPRAA